MPLTATVSDGKVEEVPVGFNQGAIIMLIARTYSTITEVICELAQNLIDARATRAVITLDMKKRRLTSTDNGRGTSSKEVKARLASIGTRFKGKDDVGEKNIGNLAPIGIGERYSLVSKPWKSVTNEGWFRLHFDREFVKTQNVSFRLETLPKTFALSPEWARTAVSVSGIELSALRAISKSSNPAEPICHAISEAFSRKLKEYKTQITVQVIREDGTLFERNVVPQEFPGKQEVLEIPTPAGDVRFEMCLTRNKQKSPNIIVDHQGRIQFSLRHIEDLWTEVTDVFASGHFQGYIRADFCEILEDKKGFVYNQGLEYFSEAVLKFVKEYARPWMEELSTMRDIEMFEDIAQNVLDAAAKLMKDFPNLRSEIFKGVVTDGHVNSEGGSESGKVRTVRMKSRKESDVPGLHERKEPEKEKKNIVHTGVSSKTGSLRHDVKHQCGLVLYPGEGTGWRAKVGSEGEERGKIVINLAHPDYRDSQISGSASLDTYIRLLVMGIISKALIPSAERADVFHKEYEAIFMALRAMVVPQIPKRARE